MLALVTAKVVLLLADHHLFHASVLDQELGGGAVEIHQPRVRILRCGAVDDVRAWDIA